MADVKYTVTVDASGAVTSIKTLDAELQKLQGGQDGVARSSTALGAATKTTSGIFSAITKQATQMWAQFVAGQFIVDALRRSFRMLKDFVVESVQASQEAEAADKALASALAITGRAIPVTAMANFASALQSQTRFSDEAIKGVQTLLVQMTTLEREGLDTATKGVIGLATVLQTDLSSAARLMQKAMEGNFASLSRYGLKVTETATLEEKRAELMEKTIAMYGRAQAEAMTFTGRVDQLKNAFNDVQEKIGDAVVKSDSFNETLTLLKVTMEQFGAATSTTNGPLGVFYTLVEAAGREIKERLAPMLAFLAAEQAKANAEQKKINDAYDAGDALWEKMGWNAVNLTGKVFDLAGAFKELGLKSGDELRTSLDLAKKALAEYTAEGGKAPGVLAALKQKIADLTDALMGPQGPAKAWRENREAMKQFMEEAQKNFIPLTMNLEPPKGTGDKWVSLGHLIGGELGAVIDSTTEKTEDLGAGLVRGATQLSARAKEIILTFQLVQQAVQMVAASWEAFSNQAARNSTIALDNEYKKRLDVINLTVKDEAKKQAAIMALEAEFQIKRQDAARKGATMTKVVGSMEALVNTYAGAARAYKDFPFPLSVIVSGIVAGLGLAQVAMIAKQPIPLAKGAVFSRPTLLPALTGPTYKTGDAGPGNPEIIAPKSTIREAVMEAFVSMPQLAMAGITVNINSPLISTHGLSNSELEQAAPLLLDKVKGELRRFGMGR